MRKSIAALGYFCVSTKNDNPARKKQIIANNLNYQRKYKYKLKWTTA